MQKHQFIYVTFIRTTPEKLWAALTEPEFTQRYWMQSRQESTWKTGASWQLLDPQGQTINSGEIVEIDPPRKLVLTWRKEVKPDQVDEGYSRATYTLEPQRHSVKLTVLHEMDKHGTKLMQAVSGGWPLVLASLKSLLETGQPLEESMHYVPCGAAN